MNLPSLLRHAIVLFTAMALFGAATPAFGQAKQESRDTAAQESRDTSAFLKKTYAAVTVKGQKPVFDVRPDRTVIHVAGAVAFSGSTVLDILQRTPGVSVDRQSASIGMNGKTGVTLMINGKILRIPMDAAIQMLSGTNSASVERIELITVPPAGYDAEGNGGLINIVMKKDTRFGTNGSFTASGAWSKGWQGSASVDLNHRQGKLNVYGNLSLSDIRSSRELQFYHASSFGGVPVATNTSAPGSFYIANGGGQVGFDYQADKRTVIGGLVSGYGFGNLVGIRSFNSGTYLTGSEVDSVTRLYDHEIHNTYNLNANLNLEHQFSSATKLVANVDYLHWLDDNPISYRDSTSGASGEGGYGRVLSSHKRTVIHTWVAQADYSRQLSPAVTLLTGLKGTLSRFVNAVDVDSLTGKGWDREAGFSAMGTLNEAYPAAYVSVKAQVDPKTAINGGLRYEYTDSRLRSDTGSGLHRRYGDWFPTVLLSRQLGKAGSFDVSVNRRITRPTFNDMAPWVLLIDDYTIFSGNPGLLPALLDNASLHYSYRKADLNLSYSYERHSISDFFPSVNPETHVETLSAINLDYTKVLSASFSVPVRVSSWWKMSWSVNTEWRRMEVNGSAGQGPGGAGMGLGGSIAAERWSAKLTASQDFSLPSDWSASASGYYQSPSSDGYYATSSCGSLDLAVRKNFGTAGKLTVNATNVLNSLGQVYSMTQPNLVTRLYVRFQYPGVRVTYTRSFGNNGVKGHRERETGAETERERVK